MIDTPHILVVDDDKEIAGLVEIYLRNEGYRVTRAGDGREALAALEKHPVQLVILDIMMPRVDGLEVCRRIRKEGNIPVIMLSAKSEEMDKIMGLGTGADDYVTKPFHPMELVARVKSQLRRYLYLNTRPAAASPRRGGLAGQGAGHGPVHPGGAGLRPARYPDAHGI